jgi:hypothetical protein
MESRKRECKYCGVKTSYHDRVCSYCKGIKALTKGWHWVFRGEEIKKVKKG